MVELNILQRFILWIDSFFQDDGDITISVKEAGQWSDASVKNGSSFSDFDRMFGVGNWRL